MGYNAAKIRMKKIIIVTASIIVSISVFAQSSNYRYSDCFWCGHPTKRDSYMNLLFTGGYQMLFHEGSQFHTGNITAEAVFSFFGARASISYGPGYFMYSPVGLIMFAPAVFMRTLSETGGSGAGAGILLALAFSAAQWHIPVSNHIEINLGWDALKFVKMKNFDSGTYIAGSLNAGVTGYIGDMLFLSAYYEFNHSHNLIVNWTGGFGGAVGSQPSFLNGHSFGIRVGCQI